MYFPGIAYVDGATDVDSDADLSWIARSYTNSQDVYFGFTKPPLFLHYQIATTYDPDLMTTQTKYYRRIDEVNSSGNGNQQDEILKNNQTDPLY
jgi:hypothetical protein